MSNHTLPLDDAYTQIKEWTISEGARPILFSLVFPFVCLVIISFPYHFEKWQAVAIVLMATYAAFITSSDFSPDDTLNEIYTRYTLIMGSHMLSLIYKIDRSKESQPHLEYKTANPTWSPWYRGYKLLWNSRGVGTSWENVYLWPGIKYTGDAPKSPMEAKISRGSRHNLTTKGRWIGIAIRFLYLALNFIVLACVYEFLTPQFLLNAGPSDYTSEKESIIRRTIQTYLGSEVSAPVTQREFQMRAVYTISVLTTDILLLSLYHDFCAIVFIAIGLDESWEWPPFFGQLSKAYSMRRWWSMFWHRSIYRSFVSHSDFILKPFNLKNRPLLYRTLTAFIVFGLSGVMHGLVTWKLGNACAWGRSLFYWILHPVAFLLEGIIQGFWARTKRGLGLGNSGQVKVFERVVGFAWVCAFFMWDQPKQNLPLVNCSA